MSDLYEPPDAKPTNPDPTTTVHNGDTKQDTVESDLDISTPYDRHDLKQAPSLQEQAQNLSNQALQFLSTASNEAIGACLVGLGATTYIILGRVGLVLMGVVGGVVLHATWEGHSNTDGEAKLAEESRRREVGLDVVKRALAWKAGKEEEKSAMDRIEIVPGQKLDYTGFQPQTQEALNEFTDATIRDYVK